MRFKCTHYLATRVHITRPLLHVYVYILHCLWVLYISLLEESVKPTLIMYTLLWTILSRCNAIADCLTFHTKQLYVIHRDSLTCETHDLHIMLIDKLYVAFITNRMNNNRINLISHRSKDFDNHIHPLINSFLLSNRAIHHYNGMMPLEKRSHPRSRAIGYKSEDSVVNIQYVINNMIDEG